jgi:hypothetical protein
MSVHLRLDEPYAWRGSVQPLGLLEAAPELLPEDGPARPGALLGLCGARAAGVPVLEAGCAQPECCAALGGATGWGRVKA